MNDNTFINAPVSSHLISLHCCKCCCLHTGILFRFKVSKVNIPFQGQTWVTLKNSTMSTSHQVTENMKRWNIT